MEVEDILPQAKQDVQDFLEKNPQGIVIIRGATATGKSKLSTLLSTEFPMEIISSDSRQVFKQMDIGTDKIPLARREKIPHHLIDIISPRERFTAGQRKNETNRIIPLIHANKKTPFIVGGTGLYIDTIYKNFSLPEGSSPDYAYRNELEEKEKSEAGSLRKMLHDVDPEEAKNHHPNSLRYIIRALEIVHTTGKCKAESFFEQAPAYPILMLGLRREKEETNRRIDLRIKEMIEGGLAEEVQGLLDKGYEETLQSMQGIGYKETVDFLEGNTTREEREAALQTNTHRLAKRQRTRFRRYINDEKNHPKQGVVYKCYELG